MSALGDHAVLDSATDEAVLHLCGDEGFPAVLLAELSGLGDLPRGVVAQADMAHLSVADETVQRGEGFLDRRPVVPEMDLVEIDVVGVKPGQAIVQRFGQVAARGAQRVSVGRRVAKVHGAGEEPFGRNDDRIAATGNGLAYDPLAGPGVVGVGGVDEVTPPRPETRG